jgi:hypothetical protein
MASAYPGGLDDFAGTSPTYLADDDATGRKHSERHNDVELAVEAVQAELGTDPAGASATVKARFEAIEGDVRWTDDRDPTAHAASHADGGSDEVTLSTAQVTGLDAALTAKAPRTMLYLPATGSDFVSAPDSAGLSITSDIDIRIGVKLTDWTDASTVMLISKADLGSQNSWRFGMAGGSGIPLFYWSTDGSTSWKLLFPGSSAPAFSDGTEGCLRVTLDVDDGSGQHVATFYTSSDNGATWTILGSAQTGSGTTSIFDSTTTVKLNGANPFAGSVLWAEIRNGIGGTVVASPTFTAPMDPRTRDAQGNVWSNNGSSYSWMVR